MIFGFFITRAKAIGLSLALMGTIVITGRAQGIIYVAPQPPLFYSDLFTSQNIDINNDGISDFNLISPNGIEINLNPLNNNSVLSIPEPSPDSGVLVAALNQGTAISSSLSPTMVWYDNNSPYGGSATIVASTDIGSIGYFQGNISAYAGFQLSLDGNTYYGWFFIQNLGLNIGKITSWAYESSPNTPITAGAVPEPATWALLAVGATFLFCRRK